MDDSKRHIDWTAPSYLQISAKNVILELELWNPSLEMVIYLQEKCISLLHYKKCEVIKQNESEVGSDMLLVSN